LRCFDSAFDELPHRNSPSFKLQPVGVHFRKHQQIFGQPRQPPRMLYDNFQKSPAILWVVYRSGQQRFRKP
jgi:hypothetical protein